MSVADFLTPLELVGKLGPLTKGTKGTADAWRSRSGSLIEFTQPTRVEPIVLLDQRAMAVPFVHDVMQTLSSVFTAYYLQALSLSVNVNGVDTIKELDRLNPKRDPVGNFLGAVDSTLGVEEYKLPREFGSVSVENKDMKKAVEEASNLSVGKMIEVKVGHEKDSAVIPVMVRLIVAGMAPKTLVHTLAVDNGERSLKERWHAWRAGQLEFVRDIILCQDLLKKHRNNLIKDPSGYYSEAVGRSRSNQFAATLSDRGSAATASGMFVITEKTKMELEAQIGGKLDDFKTREALFEKTFGMILVVIDPEWEQAVFYHQSIDTPTELSARDLKQANRGSGPDVFEILKAYQLGQSPSI